VSPGIEVIRGTGGQAAAPTAADDNLRTGCTVTDGDTIRCGRDRIRLAVIDAPELPGHCNPRRACTPGDPYASQANLERMIGSNSVSLRILDTDRYNRLVACVSAGGIDLSNAQVDGGYAVERYRPLSDCR
jgi:endonuclease YncB( thermonuclease family)